MVRLAVAWIRRYRRSIQSRDSAHRDRTRLKLSSSTITIWCYWSSQVRPCLLSLSNMSRRLDVAWFRWGASKPLFARMGWSGTLETTRTQRWIILASVASSARAMKSRRPRLRSSQMYHFSGPLLSQESSEGARRGKFWHTCLMWYGKMSELAMNLPKYF